jgi:hypothetical protein
MGGHFTLGESMRVRIIRKVNCGAYTKVTKFTDDAKPTKKTWEGVDSKGRHIVKKLYECRQNHKCANRTVYIVRLDKEHNLGDSDMFMPLKAFVAEFTV